MVICQYYDTNNNTHKYVHTFNNYFVIVDENIAKVIWADSTPINRTNLLTNNNNYSNYDNENHQVKINVSLNVK